MEDCEYGKYKRVLWGHEWSLCLRTRNNKEAHARKKRIIEKGYKARVQYVYEDENIYYVWWR